MFSPSSQIFIPYWQWHVSRKFWRRINSRRAVQVWAPAEERIGNTYTSVRCVLTMPRTAGAHRAVRSASQTHHLCLYCEFLRFGGAQATDFASHSYFEEVKKNQLLQLRFYRILLHVSIHNTVFTENSLLKVNNYHSCELYLSWVSAIPNQLHVFSTSNLIAPK